MYKSDTIVACATAAGRAAIAVVRMSGPESFRIADRVIQRRRSVEPEPWRLHRCTAIEPSSGEPLDDVLAVRMPGPRTYTGEDVVELHCHGSPLLVERLIAACTQVGARQAERGEFTRRAVLNGRMDLVQAEGVADLIDARVTGGARLAWNQLQGALSRRLAELRGQLLHVLADIEANVDFSDDELPMEDDGARIDGLSKVDVEIGRLLDGFEIARRWYDGYRVVFTGRPNVGKSSLVNALLGYGRMIVSDDPGTTRDSVEEVVDLDGGALVLTDTAGIRVAPGDAEAQAVERAKEKLRDADVVVAVLDSSQALTEDDRAILTSESEGGQPRIVVLNKVDLPRALSAEIVRGCVSVHVPVVEVSARTGTGCDRLVAVLGSSMSPMTSDQDGAGISRERHRTALLETRRGIGAAIRLLLASDNAELVSVELRDALNALATITDPTDNEDVLDHIFAEFCIGK